MKTSLSVHEIVQTFLQYHRKIGCNIFESAPFVSNDPTVMFVNATITPFKSLFTEPSSRPENFALIQKCFRMGSIEGLDYVGKDPFYFTFFEMCGSGLFDLTHIEAVDYLMGLLQELGLYKKKIIFTIPKDEMFRAALLANNIAPENIFALETNGVFWQSWKFGRGGPVGKGLTVIYSSSGSIPVSVYEMTSDPDNFIELLNLIHIYGQDENGKVIPAYHPGFDLGMGLERIASLIHGCTGYEIDTIAPLVSLTSSFLDGNHIQSNLGTTRAITDHLRAVCMLLDEGISASNKRNGYVLRKLIRHLLEMVWSSAERIVKIDVLVEDFVPKLCECGQKIKITSPAVCQVIKNESDALTCILREVL